MSWLTSRLHRIVLIKKLVVCHLFKKFSARHKTQSLITVFTRARHLYLSQINPFPTLQPCLFRVRFGMSSMSRSYMWFSLKILYAFLLDPEHATRSVHHIRLDLITPINTLTEASQCTISSITNKLPSSTDEMFTWAPTSQATSVCVLFFKVEY